MHEQGITERVSDMPSVRVRLTDDRYQELVGLAWREHRSIGSQARMLLEEAIRKETTTTKIGDSDASDDTEH